MEEWTTEADDDQDDRRGGAVRITFKQRPRETGLRSIGAGPRSSAIKVDGVEVGSVSALGGDWRGPLRGWCYFVRFNGEIANSHGSPCETQDEAKAAAKAWILAQAVKS